MQTNFIVRIYKEKTYKADEDIILNLFISTHLIGDLIGDHDCDCQINKVEFIHLLKYSDKIARHWQEIAVHLNIPSEKILIIDVDHPYVKDKCFSMFKVWLQLQSTPLCWCHFIQALYAVGLNIIANEAKSHLKLLKDTSSLGILSEGTVKHYHYFFPKYIIIIMIILTLIVR